MRNVLVVSLCFVLIIVGCTNGSDDTTALEAGNKDRETQQETVQPTATTRQVALDGYLAYSSDGSLCA
ncbi:MAG: hypothetical protein L0154_13875 [Chloroflexi bacterium]|nr:hypothetical protein [Chloroflexota bacterium]